MKIFSITKLHQFLANHPQEDFFIISNKYPIFIVADGVTLNFDNEKDYPKESGAFEAAKIFCQAAISEAEKRYDNFEEKDLKEVFEHGNYAVLEYNIFQNRTKNTINHFDIDFFSTTASFVLIKNKKVYWWSLCDAGLALFNKKGDKLFKSPDGWQHFPKDWKEGKNNKEKIITRHRDYRNTIGEDGKLSGYGVADGEETAVYYLNSGVLDVKKGDIVFVYTDGFENYISLPIFIELFKVWPEDLDDWLNRIISEKSKEDLHKFGAEKTLIAISI